MAHATRADEAVERLLDRVVAGEFADRPLPREQDLAAEVGVSRTTLREVVKVLTAHGVLRSEQGRGTFAQPLSEWTSVELVARVVARDPNSSLHLVEARRLLETGAAALFARRCTHEQLHGLDQHLDRMSAAHESGDVAAFVAADLAFHDAILQGSGNPFVPLMYRPIAAQLLAARTETSAHHEVRRNAIDKHRSILTALRTGDADASFTAMLAHLNQTRDDLATYVS